MSAAGRSTWKKARHRMELWCCRAGFWIFPRLPRPMVLRMAKILGWIAFRLMASARRVALANLELALGASLDERGRRRTALRSFQSSARTALETLSARRLLGSPLEEHFEFSPGSLDLLARLVARKNGLIALTFHYGNWEWLSLAWGMAGYPVTAVAQPIKNPEAEKLFLRNREMTGHRLLPRRHAARLLYKALRQQETIGLLVDLNIPPSEGGAFFDFFGLPALTTRVVGHLAIRTGAPVVCSVAFPLPDGRYRIEIGPEIPCDRQAPTEQETDAITRRWLKCCEEVIRREPSHWMWMYKRWKVRPKTEDARYPFYSFYDPKLMP